MGQTCSYILVQPGDSCGSLATRCGITGAQFTEYNPGANFCSTLMPRQPVCCSEGSLPDLKPKQNDDGTCFAYTVQSGDYCALIAEEHFLSVADIETYNEGQTWGWTGCAGLQAGANICLSPGTPPMPSVVDNAVCGPQVANTSRPSDWSQIASLNPCPLNACCNVWGQCGITAEFCTQTQSPTGAPGTGGCISNCGTDIVRGSPPAEFLRVGYWQAYNHKRPCLNMAADQIPTGYTHMHFAFGGVTGDFAVDLSGVEEQFELFAQQTHFKRVLAFGGWSFSTEADSAPIFGSAVSHANRLAFAQSVADVVSRYDLDGVDFDWEYPGATDIPGMPPGSPSDGENYLAFLVMVRNLLPAGKTLSVAAPASFWYLRGFPIARMAPVVDYVVYMTYDLHGQWDYGSAHSQLGCPQGDCLRSHVNLTETLTALSMITKAGVPSSKIVVGLASYGRSFGMVSRGCRMPPCKFTGPASGAAPGRCTGEPGVVAQAEVAQIVQENVFLTRAWYDPVSDSDLVQWNDTWAAYMTEGTKAARTARYRTLNFGGTADWAVDLAAFVPGDPGLGAANDTAPAARRAVRAPRRLAVPLLHDRGGE